MKAKYFRHNHQIQHLDETGHPIHIETLKSINAAKRRSRELQSANGGIGNGSLKVVEKLLPMNEKEANNA